MNILDFLFPKECILCNKIGEYLCDRCLKSIPRTLPLCSICNKLNQQYRVHNNCLDLNIQFFTGWYLTKNIDYRLLIKMSSNIYSPFLFLLNNLINYLDISNIISKSIVLPIYTKDKGESNLNTYLANSIRNHNTKHLDILFVGYTKIDREEILENIKRLPKRESLNIRFLTLFVPSYQ